MFIYEKLIDLKDSDEVIVYNERWYFKTEWFEHDEILPDKLFEI